MPKIRGQPGMRAFSISICTRGRLAAEYVFVDAKAWKDYMASPFYGGLVASFKKQKFFNPAKQVDEFVGYAMDNF